MDFTQHFRKRESQRGFGPEYLELLDEHGQYIEQKGGGYVLRMAGPELETLRQEFTERESELFNRAHKLKSRIKKLQRSKEAKDEQDLLQLSTKLSLIKKELSTVQKLKRGLRPGYAVFNREDQSSPLRAITVAKPYRKIKGYKILN